MNTLGFPIVATIMVIAALGQVVSMWGLFGQRQLGEITDDLIEETRKKFGMKFTRDDLYKAGVMKTEKGHSESPAPGTWQLLGQNKEWFTTYYHWFNPETLAFLVYNRKEKECASKNMAVEVAENGSMTCVPFVIPDPPDPNNNQVQTASMFQYAKYGFVASAVFALGYMIYQRIQQRR